ncbi:MAG TPA: pyridoxamine 5'-phosphate oxidase family protein [Acidimicrobiales bacterium]|nr:pyridoxamine 5'-phosphate oxidase family protein [Acidimicrobiales bacterium]
MCSSPVRKAHSSDGSPERTTSRRRVGAVWHDGDLYFTSGPDTRKARNVTENPYCTAAVKLPGMDVALEGEATRVIDPTVLEQLARIYREIGWPAEVAVDAFSAPYSAPSAGPPPWNLYRFVIDTVVAISTSEPNAATRWHFA